MLQPRFQASEGLRHLRGEHGIEFFSEVHQPCQIDWLLLVHGCAEFTALPNVSFPAGGTQNNHRDVCPLFTCPNGAEHREAINPWQIQIEQHETWHRPFTAIGGIDFCQRLFTILKDSDFIIYVIRQERLSQQKRVGRVVFNQQN